MTEAESIFKAICDKTVRHQEGVAHGKMMTAPAIKYKGKVFAFFHNEKMTFKLGKGFDPASIGIEEWSHLSPFKNKPPMQAWFEIAEKDAGKWEELAMMALDLLRK